jgi:hypothetical protein
MLRIAVLVSLTACNLETAREVSADDPLPLDLAVGDIVRAGDIALEVPEPGETVAIVIERDDGTSQELALANPKDGPVRIVTLGEPDVLAATSNPCQDDAFRRAGHHWNRDYAWKFQAGSTPSANNKDNVETGLVHAANAIANSRNDCGLDDTVSATNTYAGRTSNAPNIRVTDAGAIRCTARDDANVVGFGPLPTSYLAVACSWWDGDGIDLEGDVRLSTHHDWYPLDVPSSCTRRFGIQPTATHEFGHVFGLAHVSESEHPNLTMSPVLMACSNASLTLGLGDVRGLRALY